MPEDRIQREIEDILNRLDALPDERVVPFRRRRMNLGASLGRLAEPLAQISVRQVMLASLVLIVAGFIAIQAVQPDFGRWVLIAGVILFFTSFAIQIFNRGSTRGSPRSGPAYQKRWRGQPMDLDGPGFGEKLRGWFSGRKPPQR